MPDAIWVHMVLIRQLCDCAAGHVALPAAKTLTPGTTFGPLSPSAFTDEDKEYYKLAFSRPGASPCTNQQAQICQACWVLCSHGL